MSFEPQNVNSHIKEVCLRAADPLQHVANSGAEKIHEFSFDLALMRDFSNEDIRDSAEHKEDFIRLASITGPVVYVFEVISDTTSDSLLQAAHSYSGNRAMPAFKASVNPASRILYVGKVKRNFWGRVIQHLGFYKVTATQGLQLFHWAAPLHLKVKLTAFEFRGDMSELLPLVENSLAHALHPLIGKHK